MGMSQEGKVHVNNMMMFALSKSILLRHMRVGDTANNATILQFHLKFMRKKFLGITRLQGFNLTIKQILYMKLRCPEDSEDVSPRFHNKMPREFTSIINKMNITMMFKY